MRIIDKTPFVSEDGSISLVNRIQGTLQNGFSWYGNLQAQAQAVAFFEKQLDKKFTLIRNHSLGASKITIPFIIIGPPGVYVCVVTDVEGTYRAKGNSWGTVDGEKYKEASVNLLKRTIQYAKVADLYIQKQGLTLPRASEPILLALNPGLHIESVRPAVRIVMSDALERFAATLRQAPPIMAVEDGHQVSEALLSPLRKAAVPVAIQAVEEPEPVPVYDLYGEADSFQAEEEPASNAFGDFGFSFDDEEAPAEEFAPVVQDMESARPRTAAKTPQRKAAKSGLFGLSQKQLIILASMAGFVALILILVSIVALMSL